MKIEIIDKVKFEKEDGGMALIATLINEHVLDEDDDKGVFVRFQSWDEDKDHEEALQFEGKRVRVTIETIDE